MSTDHCACGLKPACVHRILMPSFLLPGDGSFPGRGPKFCLLLAEQEHMQVNDKNASAVHVADIGSSRGRRHPGRTAGESPCGPAHNRSVTTDHSWPSKHARHGQLHSRVFKTKGNLYTGPVFQPVCYLFAFYPMGILQTLG